jgi:hypothetical protein
MRPPPPKAYITSQEGAKDLPSAQVSKTFTTFPEEFQDVRE